MATFKVRTDYALPVPGKFGLTRYPNDFQSEVWPVSMDEIRALYATLGRFLTAHDGDDLEEE